MESTGIKNRIQCSTATAELLLASGKSQWITPREEKVFAKGKGELQTYWVQINKNSSNTATDATAANAAAGAENNASNNTRMKTASTSSPSEVSCPSEVGGEELLLEEGAVMDNK
jgi:hypothetical protein